MVADQGLSAAGLVNSRSGSGSQRAMLLQRIVLALWVAIALPAAAQQPAPQAPLSSSLLPCDAFKKNLDGDWVAKRDVMVPGPTGPTQIKTGTPVDEILQDELEHRCK
jgi:hypothetical protein